MTRPDSFNQQLLNRDRDSGESHGDVALTPTTAGSNRFAPFPSPGSPPLPPPPPTSQLTPIAGSASHSPSASTSSPAHGVESRSPPTSRGATSITTHHQQPLSNSNGSATPTAVQPVSSHSNTNATNDSNNNNNNSSSSSRPPTSGGNMTAADNNNNNTNYNNDGNDNINNINNDGSQNGPSAAEAVPQTTLQRNPSRPPPRYETIRNQLVAFPQRVRHSLAAVSHEMNDQFAPRQRRRPSTQRRAPAAAVANGGGGASSSRTNSRAEMRMSSNSATPYDVDLMPPALAVIGFVSSFLVLIALIVFVKISSFAANIVGIAYSAAVLATSSVVVIRYYLEKRSLKKMIDSGEGAGLLGGNRRFNSLRRVAMMGRHRQHNARGVSPFVDGGIEAGQAHEEMEMRGEIIVVPIQPVNRGHEIAAEVDPELPPYSPRRDQVIHVT